MNYCKQANLQCEHCNSNGYCMITGCTKRGSQTISTEYNPKSYKVIQLTELTDECIDRIADAVVRRTRNECNH